MMYFWFRFVESFVFIKRERSIVFCHEKEMSQLEQAPARRDSQKIHGNLWKHKLLEEELTIMCSRTNHTSSQVAGSVCGEASENIILCTHEFT